MELDALSSLQKNLSFLNLDSEKEEKLVNGVNNEAIGQNKETAANDDVVYNNNDDIVDGKIQLDNQSYKEEISKDFRIFISCPSNC